MVVSNCTMGMSRGCLFYGLIQSCAGKWVKVRLRKQSHCAFRPKINSRSRATLNCQYLAGRVGGNSAGARERERH